METSVPSKCMEIYYSTHIYVSGGSGGVTGGAVDIVEPAEAKAD